jgi:hypothetical protein
MGKYVDGSNDKLKGLLSMHFHGRTEDKYIEFESRQSAFCRDLNRYHLNARQNGYSLSQPNPMRERSELCIQHSRSKCQQFLKEGTVVW